MVLRKITGLFVCALILGSVAFATAGIPDPLESLATMPNGGGSPLALFNLPNGNGNGFMNAQVVGVGTEVDATIDLTVNDAFGVPVTNFPAEDMWLESTGGGMVPCIGGTAADQDTDDLGYTTWANPLRAGGYDAGTCEVMVNGNPLISAGVPFALAFNSSDITGDGVVNLADVGLFSGVLFGAYDFSADFFADGTMNLADVGRMALGLGAACP